MGILFLKLYVLIVIFPPRGQVVVCDCVYYEASLQPLVSTILGLLRPAASSQVILAYERRPDKADLYTEFFSLMEQRFTVTEAGRLTLDNKNDVFLYQMQIKL